MKPRLAATAGALALAFSVPLLAASLPAPQTQNGITYLSGGIGQDEAKAMKSEVKHYPLSIVLSEGKHDAYVAGARVTIADKAGKVLLDSVAAGPIMLVKLPEGHYRITASADGKTQHRSVLVKAKGERQVVFHWRKAA